MLLCLVCWCTNWSLISALVLLVSANWTSRGSPCFSQGLHTSSLLPKTSLSTYPRMHSSPAKQKRIPATLPTPGSGRRTTSTSRSKVMISVLEQLHGDILAYYWGDHRCGAQRVVHLKKPHGWCTDRWWSVFSGCILCYASKSEPGGASVWMMPVSLLWWRYHMTQTACHRAPPAAMIWQVARASAGFPEPGRVFTPKWQTEQVGRKRQWMTVNWENVLKSEANPGQLSWNAAHLCCFCSRQCGVVFSLQLYFIALQNKC